MLPSDSPGGCRHLWQPRADEVRIWQVCMRCGEERHVCTHDEQLRATLAWIFTH